jgi:hypothetical protein
MSKEKTPSWLKYNEDGSADITLSRPREIDGVKTAAVRMREPLVEDQTATDHLETDSARERAMLANLCMVSPGAIQKLPLSEYKRLQTAFLGFIV